MRYSLKQDVYVYFQSKLRISSTRYPSKRFQGRFDRTFWFTYTPKKTINIQRKEHINTFLENIG